MLDVTSIPLLAELPRVELAKLLNDLEEQQAESGATVANSADLNGWIYFLMEGEVELIYEDAGQGIPVTVARPGELLGEFSPKQMDLNQLTARAVTPVMLVRLPRTKFERILRDNPKISDQFYRYSCTRMAESLRELARTRNMLSAYSDAIWTDVPSAQLGIASAIQAEPVIPLPASPQLNRAKQASQSWLSRNATQVSLLVLGTVLSATVYYLHPGPAKLAGALAILAWATWNWLLETLPDYVVGFTTTMALIITGTVPSSVALSGFSSSAWFLLIGISGIAVAVAKSGLLYRIALHLLRLLSPTYGGQTLAMAVTGILLTPFLPPVNSRVVMSSPLAFEISTAMRFPERSKGAAGLVMSSWLGFGLMYFMFLNGANMNLLAWSALPPDVREQVTWASWLWTALPLAILIFAGCYLTIRVLYKPETTVELSRESIAAQLAILGRMSRNEWIISVIMVAVLVGFMTQPLHNINPAWLAILGLAMLAALRIIDKNSLKTLDWGFLMMFATLVSLADVVTASGVGAELSKWLQPILEPLRSNPYLFLAAVAFLALGIRMVVPAQTAVLMMVLTLMPLSIQMGYNPFVVALVVLATSMTWIVPQQNNIYLSVHSSTAERAFTHQQARPFAVAHAVVSVAAVLATVPFWQYLGLVP